MTLTAHPILDTPRGRSAFRFLDPEGAPDTDGRRYHAAIDWFAPGGSPAMAAAAGIVVEARPSRGNSGQVFGGTVKIRRAAGREIFVMRHVDPAVRPGDVVKAGQVVAHVTRWTDGPSHAHVEIWRTLEGGYFVPNMIDPDAVKWTTTPAAKPWPPKHGGGLRLSLPGHDVFAGWGECIGPMRNIARNGLRDAAGCFITWRGNRWNGMRQVEGVVRHLLREYVDA